MPWILRTLVLVGLVTSAPLGATLHRYPLADPEGERLTRRADGRFFIIHVDHDPAPSAAANLQCLAFDGAKNFPNCYDAHHGTDYLLEGAFEAMDAGSLEVVAAADGVVQEAVDGNYDRCHADAASQGVSCDGHPGAPNYVALEHADGRVTFYYHLKQGSVLVTPGELVACGQPLGLVGSSGWSSTPHLHFQVEDAAGAWIDPYAGPNSQPDSLWVAQDGPYGLPGAWCEGEEPVLPEPDPEPVEVEALPEVVEAEAESFEAGPDVVEAVPDVVEAVLADVETLPEVTDDAAAREDWGGAGERSAVGCHASRTGASPFDLAPLLFGLLALYVSMGTNSSDPKTSR